MQHAYWLAAMIEPDDVIAARWLARARQVIGRLSGTRADIRRARGPRRRGKQAREVGSAVMSWTGGCG